MTPDDVRLYWIDPQMFTTSLLALFIDVFGTDSLEWHPVTIQMEVEQEFGVELPPVNYEKLMTGISLLTLNTFFTSLPDFSRACVVMSGHHPSQDLLILPDAADLAWGITEGLLIAPPDTQEEDPFSEEITAFIGKVLDSEGILNPPDVLQIATRDNDLVNRVTYDYSDDPELFSSIHKMEASKTEDINGLIRGRIRGLIMQLKSLPFRTGNASKLTSHLLSKFPGDEALPLPT